MTPQGASLEKENWRGRQLASPLRSSCGPPQRVEGAEVARVAPLSRRNSVGYTQTVDARAAAEATRGSSPSSGAGGSGAEEAGEDSDLEEEDDSEIDERTVAFRDLEAVARILGDDGAFATDDGL